jgi:hypothetical protein
MFGGASERDRPGASAVTSDLARLLICELPDDALDELVTRLVPRLSRVASASSDPWLRGAQKIARYIDCPVSRVYALASAGRIPVERDGSSLIARCSDLDRWVREGGGKRP